MADESLNEENKGDTQIPPKEDVVSITRADLVAIQKALAKGEQDREADRAKMAGLEELLQAGAGAEVDGSGKLRERKNYEPKFRTVRIRKYPMANKFDDLGYVVGWSSRGAYQEVDRTGISPQIVDFVDVAFLGHEKNEEGKLQYEKIKLLDLLNKGEQIHCKILEAKNNPRKEPTNEEINVTVWDPQHGLVATGDMIDGYTAFTDTSFVIEIPGVGKAEIDGMYVN